MNQYSSNNKFAAFIDATQNEILIYDSQSAGKLKCLARKKPEDLKVKYTCLCLQGSSLYVGHSNGLVSVLDCNQGKVVSNFNIGTTAVRHIAPLNKSAETVVICTCDKYLIYDTAKGAVRQSLKPKKHSEIQIPLMFDISYDDKYSIEVIPGQDGVQLRDLVTNSILTKFEGHSSAVSTLRFVAGAEGYQFVTTAGNECLLWDFPINKSSKSVEEVIQPAKILDIENSSTIRQIGAYQIVPGAILVGVVADRTKYVFMAKINKDASKQKSKVKKADSVITLKENNQNIICSEIVSDRTFEIIYGNQMQMVKETVQLFDDVNIRKSIELVGISGIQAASKLASKAEDYAVTEMADQRQMRTMGSVSLFNQSNLNLEPSSSRKTSAETNNVIQGGSLATILQQALVSEDKDQLDWILSTNEVQMIDKTLNQIKDHKIISLLFASILTKFQEQRADSDISSLTLWLKQLLKTHWVTIVKCSPSNLAQNQKSLMGIKQFIESKTKHLNEIVLVKGKLEMLKTTYTIQDPCQKFQKIKNNLKKIQENEDDKGVLVYQDESDDGEELNQMMDDASAEEGESDYDSDQSDDEDEQIQEMDIIKRQRLDSDDEELDDEMAALDDSVSEDNEILKKAKKNKKSKKSKKASKQKAESEEDDDLDENDVFDSEDEDEQEMRKRLIQDSDDEGQLQAGQDDADSDQMSDI